MEEEIDDYRECESRAERVEVRREVAEPLKQESPEKGTGRQAHACENLAVRYLLLDLVRVVERNVGEDYSAQNACSLCELRVRVFLVSRLKLEVG